jgi:hypothetical protein
MLKINSFIPVLLIAGASALVAVWSAHAGKEIVRVKKTTTLPVAALTAAVATPEKTAPDYSFTVTTSAAGRVIVTQRSDGKIICDERLGAFVRKTFAAQGSLKIEAEAGLENVSIQIGRQIFFPKNKTAKEFFVDAQQIESALATLPRQAKPAVATPVVLPALPKLNPLRDISLAEFRKNYPAPGRDFSSGPLWTWNDRLTEEQVRSTLRDLAAQNVKQAWVHPRPGLMTPYLSKEWFSLWKAALDEAQKLDMNIWIYDENSYPSGFAGGFVPDAMPESRGMSLTFAEVPELKRVGKEIWYVFDDAGKNITADAKKTGKLAPLPNGGKYLVAHARYVSSGGWYGGKWYVDLLKKGVTEKFLDITLDAYKNVPEIAKEFGKRVPGIFTDEPHPINLNFGGLRSSLPWNKDFSGEFEKRFGYSLADNIPSLVKKVGDWKRVRHNYHQLVLDLFIDRFAKPYAARCEQYGIEFTGHYWEHGWPGTSHGPDNMAMYAWMQRPAIDLLQNTYNDDSAGAQFGNVRSGKELASAANQMGRSRTLSENYGAGGWDLRFEDMRRLGDWSYAVGVNTNNEHLSYVTIRGARKRDHPQSFSYHSAWFSGYHVLANHFTRLSYALSQGRQINRVLLLEPTTTAWLYQGQRELSDIAKSFTKTVNALEHAQTEYDLGSEDIIRHSGKVQGTQFTVGQASYDLVILPQHCENLNKTTLTLLQEYVKNGGKLLLLGEKPSRVNGQVTDIALEAKKVTLEEAVALARSRTAQTGLSISVPEGVRSIFHHRRKLADAEVLFICNTDLKNKVEVKVKTDKHISICENGEIYNSLPKGKIYGFVLQPAGSSLVILSDEAITDAKQQSASVFAALEGGETQVATPEENVLVLDYARPKIRGESGNEAYTYKVNRSLFLKNGFAAGNPWDNQVQFKDELIKKAFPEDSAFEVDYHFTLRDTVPANLSIVVERADIYTITLNGVEIKPTSGVWWLDRAFAKIAISKTAKIGKNTLTLKASRMRIEHEIEPVYLLGNFSLENAKKGFVATAPKLLTLRQQTKATPALVHNEELNGVSWLSAGVGFSGKSDRAPALVFDLGDEKEVSGLRIWNYNEQKLKTRGVKTLEITGLGKTDLPIGDGRPIELFFDAPKKLKTIKFEIFSNHNGVAFPLVSNVKPADNAFVGLAEVQFLDAAKKPLTGVKVAPTSELLADGHDRRANYLLDGSGLGDFGTDSDASWNKQGMPFYSGKVAYTRTFQVAEQQVGKQFKVQLPSSPSGWYGATARVLVNGKPAGFVMSAPWTVDVSALVRAGANEVTVEVYGTPKNLLGPHHLGVGKQRGSAWPGHFKQAPETQPAGARYDSIGYGLFQPFSLLAEKTEDKPKN